MKYVPDDLYVQLGMYSLTASLVGGVKNISVSEIHVHHEWEGASEIRYDADIAIILLSDNVTFTNHILPVCMPPDDEVSDGVKGFIVGWGVAEDIPKHALITALNNTYCYTTTYYVDYPLSARTFCGQRGGEMPIKNISGGGFFVLSGSTWVQSGISVEIVTGNLDADRFVVLTNVRSYKDWITNTVKLSGGVVGEITQMKINLHCEYSYLYYT